MLYRMLCLFGELILMMEVVALLYGHPGKCNSVVTTLGSAVVGHRLLELMCGK